MTIDDFDSALEASVHALNSMTYSHGRPPYMAVFGQIPRVGGGLLQDDRSLVTHDAQPGVVRPDILRAEALKALAEINTSQSLRRALLRKTSTAHQHDLLPGQNCAYWRWQNPKGRSTKKRGAWVVARFLSYDPDGRSAWLHSGTTTLQVALEQIRSAYGFENWQPSKDDIKVLKDAAANLRQDLWQDHKASAPPIDEDAYDYQLDELPQPSTTYHQPTTVLPLAPPPEGKPTQQPATTTTINLPQQAVQLSTQQAQTTTSNINIFSPTNIRVSTATQRTYQPTTLQQQQPATDLDYHHDRYGLTQRARSRTLTNRAQRTPKARPRSQPATPRARSSSQPQTPLPLPKTPTQQAQQTTQPTFDQYDSAQYDSAQYESAPFDTAPNTPTERHSPPPTPLFDSTPEPPVPPQPMTIPLPIQPTTQSQAQPANVPSSPPTPTSIISSQSANEIPVPLLKIPRSTTIDYPQASTQTPQQGEQARSSTDEQPQQPDQQPLPSLPQKRTHEAMLTHIYNKLEPPHHSWDGSQETNNHNCHHSTTFSIPAAHQLQSEGYAVLETDLTGMQSESDGENTTDEDKEKEPAARLLTRKEAKALEREIPWRNIMKMPQEDINAFIESAKKEEKSWFSWGSIEAISPEAAANILSNPATKKRVLRSRACYRNKSRIPGKLIAKTRVVALGHLDPDLANLSRDSPTPSRTSEYLLLAIFTAGKNGMLENESNVTWIMWAGDVSTAFLQGAHDSSERPQDLFLLPPQDEVTRLAGTFSARLYRVKGNIYGLASAPRTWYKEVCRRLRSIKFTQHSLDHLLFYKRVNDKLMAICIVYVDDVLLACREDYEKDELFNLFKWGSSKELSLTERTT